MKAWSISSPFWAAFVALNGSACYGVYFRATARYATASLRFGWAVTVYMNKLPFTMKAPCCRFGSEVAGISDEQLRATNGDEKAKEKPLSIPTHRKN